MNDDTVPVDVYLNKCDECERLRDILRDVYCSGFEEGTAIDSYHTVQVDKRTWDDVRRAIK